MLPTAKVGDAVSYYLCGWRYGVIREAPIKGQHKGQYRIENPVSGLVWVPAGDVNAPGDTVYDPGKS